MVTKSQEKSASPAGFFEKNFLKLKQGQHVEYMLSRIIMFLTGVAVGLYYIRDAQFVHSPTGVPLSILYVAGIIFLMNGLRKMVRRFIQIREQSWDTTVLEKPHNPGESWWMRLGFRFPLGKRRGLVSVMTLLSEGVACAILLLAYFIPSITVPENLWMGLAFIEIARIVSWLNNTIFLVNLPHVRKTLAETWKGLPGAEHLALYFPMQLFKMLRGGAGGEKPCMKRDAEEIARRILAEYPETMISQDQKQELEPELVEMICKEHDPLVLLEFLKKRLAEFKVAGKVK